MNINIYVYKSSSVCRHYLGERSGAFDASAFEAETNCVDRRCEAKRRRQPAAVKQIRL